MDLSNDAILTFISDNYLRKSVKYFHFSDTKLFPAADNSSAGDGTYFLQEYMIPRGSTSFCLYDTRGLSYDSYDSSITLKKWITKGVHHRELVIRFEFLASQHKVQQA